MVRDVPGNVSILRGEVLGAEVSVIGVQGLRDTAGHGGDVGGIVCGPGLGVGVVGEHVRSILVS